MKTYIQKLQAEVAAQDDKVSADKEAGSDAAKARLTPLEDYLACLLATIPEDVRLEGLSLPALRAGLRERWRGSSHPG